MAKRNRRLEQNVRQAVAELLEDEIADPRTSFVTITDVRVSEDHRHATVYYTSLDPGVVTKSGRGSRGDRIPEDREVAEGLQSAAGRLQGLLSRRVRLKNTPVLEFEPDSVAEEGRRIEELLSRVRAEGAITDDVEDVDEDAAS